MAVPLVSIIIPVYNGEQYVSKSIKSVLSQTFRHYEVIFVNDGSTDNSSEIIRRYCQTHGNFICIDQANAGVAEARNTGIRKATGSLICLLDQDDIWLPNKLAYQVEYMKKHPECGLVHSQIGFIDGEDRIIENPVWAWVGETFGNTLIPLFLHNKIATFTALFRRSVIDQVGYFRECFAPSDDWDMWLRIARQFSLGFVPEISGYYRTHLGNESRNYLRMQLSEIKVAENFVAEFPDVENIIGKRRIKTKLSALYADSAQLLEDQGASRVAAKHWLNAVQKNPLSISAYLGVVRSQLPSQWKTAYRWYLHQLKTKVFQFYSQ